MSIDSAWIFRICLSITATLILFADALGYGGANARADNSIDNAKFIDKTRGSHKGACNICYATFTTSAYRKKTSFLHKSD